MAWVFPAPDRPVQDDQRHGGTGHGGPSPEIAAGAGRVPPRRAAGRRRQRALELEQPTLPGGIVAVVAELPVAARDAVAGQDDRQLVAGHDRAGRPPGSRMAGVARQVAIAHRAPVGDASQGAQHVGLERGAAELSDVGLEVERKRHALAREVAREQLAPASGVERRARGRPARRVGNLELDRLIAAEHQPAGAVRRAEERLAARRAHCARPARHRATFRSSQPRRRAPAPRERRRPGHPRRASPPCAAAHRSRAPPGAAAPAPARSRRATRR